jgi:hypothetical protein
MNRVVSVVALTLAVLCWTGPAQAVIGTMDQVPAATLLLPYFEVDLSNPNGITTLLSINNASANATLVHFVMYTDLSVPTLAFNIYLTGYDVQTINLRDVLNGVLPQTASVGQDPADTISPKGSRSQDSDFPSCTGFLPPPAPPAGFAANMANAHTGKASAGLAGLCAGQNLGDNIARGYVVVNTVNICSAELPGDTTPLPYFTSGGVLGTAVATNQNVLWGDYFHVNPGQGFAQGNPLVHIEADAINPATSTLGRYTFFGRYVNWTAADNREPLATSFAARFLNGGPFTGGTSLLVWRDSKTVQAPFACPAISGRPTWYPMGQEGVQVFDEQEQFFAEPTSAVAPVFPSISVTEFILPFPAEAQRTHVNGVTLPVPFTFGWMYLNLNVTVTGNPNPPSDPAAAQAAVEVVHDASGRFSVGYNAIQLDSATAPSHFVP